MLKLYGFPLSNYFNMVKIVLIEKGIDYEHVNVMPSQEADFLAKSPMGKVPCIETDDGFLSEASVILEYLEDLGQGPSFMPSDPYARGLVRELTKEMELYLELPARTCFPEAFFGGSVSDDVKASAKAALAKGVACLQRRGSFSPFLAGDQISFADVLFMYSVPLANSVSKKLFGQDLFADVPAVTALLSALSERDSAKQVAADQRG
jgi:glutathione S-transferase